MEDNSKLQLLGELGQASLGICLGVSASVINTMTKSNIGKGKSLFALQVTAQHRENEKTMLCSRGLLALLFTHHGDSFFKFTMSQVVGQ